MSLWPWDAAAYDLLALPHDRWGFETVRRLRLTGSETVMDFGCGTGRDVERLLDALPQGRIIAVDGSSSMLARLRQRLAHRLASVEIIQADLRGKLPVGPVDAVMSVATLHWLPDHSTVFSNIAEVLRAGGRFAAEAGGAGNLSAVLAAVSRAHLRLFGPREVAALNRYFPGVEETVRNLENAGFVTVDVQLVADPVVVPRAILPDFLTAIILVPELSTIPASMRPAYVNAVAQELGDPVVDWVRLQIIATRS